MKKILLHGYTMDNLGDDLFFRVITDRYPNVQFVLPTLNINYKKKYADISNLKIVDFMRINDYFHHKTYILPKLYSMLHIRRFDAVVCIGGSLFIDRKNPSENDRRETEKYSFIFDWEIAKKNHVPYYLLGANWGPCYNQYFFDYFSHAFDSMRDICFRDRYSFNLFHDKDNVRYSGDILMGASLIQKAVRRGSRKKQICISVVDASRKCSERCESENYEAKIAEVAVCFLKAGYEVVLLSFCEFEGDVSAAERIHMNIEQRSSVTVKTITYRDNWKEILDEIAKSEVMLASRFHATVLAWTLNTPVFSLAYSDKTVHFIEDYNLGSSCLRIEDMDMLSMELILGNAKVLETLSQHIGEEIAFQLLDKLLT